MKIAHTNQTTHTDKETDIDKHKKTHTHTHTHTHIYIYIYIHTYIQNADRTFRFFTAVPAAMISPTPSLPPTAE